MNDYKVVSTSVIPDLKEVRLYEETIVHIRDGHEEFPIDLPCMTNAVLNAVASPTHVEKSYGASYIFVDAETTNISGHALMVPVKHVGGTAGRVKTAFFASNSAGEIIWRKSGE